MKTKTKVKQKPTLSLRPYMTDYAGAWSGHAKTREGAIKAAVKHILEDGYTKCSITKDGESIAAVQVVRDRNGKAVKAVIDVAKPFKLVMRRVK